MKAFTTLDNKSNDDIDFIKKKLENNEGYRIVDKIDLKGDRYFLLQHTPKNIREYKSMEFTYIWIGSNIWQFRYTNIHCMHRSNWKNPLELLNSILNLK